MTLASLHTLAKVPPPQPSRPRARRLVSPESVQVQSALAPGFHHLQWEPRPLQHQGPEVFQCHSELEVSWSESDLMGTQVAAPRYPDGGVQKKRMHGTTIRVAIRQIRRW